jgi:hypothetical protein
MPFAFAQAGTEADAGPSGGLGFARRPDGAYFQLGDLGFRGFR